MAGEPIFILNKHSSFLDVIESSMQIDFTDKSSMESEQGRVDLLIGHLAVSYAKFRIKLSNFLKTFI